MTVFTFYRQLIPALASGLFQGGEGAVSLLTSANSLGAVAGAFAVLFATRYRAKGMLVVYVTIAFSASVFLFGTVTSLWLGTVMIIGMGAFDSVSMVTRQAMMQLTTPDQMLGRTLSLGSLVATTANNIGTLWVGFVAAGIGEARTMQLGGILALGCTLIVWWAVSGCAATATRSPERHRQLLREQPHLCLDGALSPRCASTLGQYSDAATVNEVRDVRPSAPPRWLRRR